MQGVRKMNQKTFKIIYLEMCMVETLVGIYETNPPP